MLRPIATALLAACLAGCGLVETLIDGVKHAHAVEADLEASTGIKPAVGFNWHNGRLETVTVTFVVSLSTLKVMPRTVPYCASAALTRRVNAC